MARTTKKDDRESLAIRIGYSECREENGKETIEIQKGALANCLKSFGLHDGDYRDPYESENINEEERKWLKKHRPHDR